MSQYRTNSYKNKRPAESSGANILTQIGVALAGLWRVFGKQSGTRLDRAKLLAQFGEIEALLRTNDAIHAAQAVVRADSFLDSIMREVGGKGASFGERLRSLEPRFSHDGYQALWDAHKLRNAIAHEHPTVSVDQARAAIQTFRRGASQLGAF